MPDTQTLDILLYAHDGRGLGHASRTIAIGMALRRLFPELRVLFLSGCKVSQQLIDKAPLDWLKLPSYETTVERGKSKGIPGHSNFDDATLGSVRAEHIKNILEVYRPKVVLADHSPLGKHKELLSGIQEMAGTKTRWVLGIRGIMGEVSQIVSEKAVSTFKDHYSTLLWYGDSHILGVENIHTLTRLYDTQPAECGYVSRIIELAKLSDHSHSDKKMTTIAIPWIGENTCDFLETLFDCLNEMRGIDHTWKIFLDKAHPASSYFFFKFSHLPCCEIFETGSLYLTSLMGSQSAVIYGGYNSIVDILSLSLPALVIERSMKDNEQQIHLNKLVQTSGESLSRLSETCSKQDLSRSLSSLLTREKKENTTIQLNGAEQAALYLHSLL